MGKIQLQQKKGEIKDQIVHMHGFSSRYMWRYLQPTV